jgi:fumarylacetoacetase
MLPDPGTVPTPDPGAWLEIPPGCDFPLANLPYGIVAGAGEPPHVGVAVGEQVFDLARAAARGLFDEHVPAARELFAAGALNPLLAAGRPTWQATRRQVRELLARPSAAAAEALVPRAAVTLSLPFEVADYVDFYSSVEHATNLGRMLRPDTEPLLANWRHLPVGYHGRAGTVVASGTPIRRPCGQLMPPGAERPEFAPTRRLDFELEIGFVTGAPTTLGTRVPTAEAAEHIFGLVLVNDWSARDIQAWEYRPLGPFCGKSFATSISGWVVPLDALDPYRVPGPVQDPPVLDHLLAEGDWNLDLELEVGLRSRAMAAAGAPPQPVSRVNARGLYWNMAQQLAHATSGGASVRAGDLYASGTVSGRPRGARGSLIEVTWNGAEPLDLPGGEQRTFLEDGDEVVLRGWCERPGRPRIGFGEVSGTVLPALTAGGDRPNASTSVVSD